MNSGDIDIIIEAEKSSREHIKGLESLVVAFTKLSKLKPVRA